MIGKFMVWSKIIDDHDGQKILKTIKMIAFFAQKKG
jgi:hypothetical protein